MLEIAFIGFALSVDAFAVSESSGVCIRNLRLFYAVRASLFFGFFQFAMPVAGWFLGSAFAVYIRNFDHWAAFLLLAFTWGRMIRGGLKKRKEREIAAADFPAAADPPYKSSSDIRSPAILLVLSTATSIDALAVGISLSLIDSGIWKNAVLIWCITFSVCLAGFAFGRRIGFLFEKWAETAGGLVLIGIGIKILADHLLSG